MQGNLRKQVPKRNKEHLLVRQIEVRESSFENLKSREDLMPPEI